MKLEFFYRTVTGEELPASLPGPFTHSSIEVVDAAGQPYEVIDNMQSEIGGWMLTSFSELPVSRSGGAIVVKSKKPDNSLIEEIVGLLGNRDPITVVAEPGDSIRVRFKVINYADEAKPATLSTGIVSFTVAGETKSAGTR